MCVLLLVARIKISLEMQRKLQHKLLTIKAHTAYTSEPKKHDMQKERKTHLPKAHTFLEWR
jgi:hypothetical protein